MTKAEAWRVAVDIRTRSGHEDPTFTWYGQPAHPCGADEDPTVWLEPAEAWGVKTPSEPPMPDPADDCHRVSVQFASGQRIEYRSVDEYEERTGHFSREAQTQAEMARWARR